MFVSGFTFVRNAVRYDYPVVESILSLLPLVDELVVCLGNSDDTTQNLIEGINDPKIKIIHSVWDDSLREGGKVLAVETDKAFAAISKKADWAIYLQADEVLHEKDYSAITNAMEQYLENSKVEGLLLRYKHFYGSYHYIGDSRRWYRNEIRIVRNNPAIHSYRDAQGFRINEKTLKVAAVDAFVYHYGWVKNPLKQLEKQKNFHKLWHNDQKAKEKVAAFKMDYSEIDSLIEFKDSQPKVMEKRIAEMDWDFKFDPSHKKLKLKDRILMQIEALTGYRLFEYKNYVRIY